MLTSDLVSAETARPCWRLLDERNRSSDGGQSEQTRMVLAGRLSTCLPGPRWGRLHSTAAARQIYGTVLAVCPPVGDLYWLSLRRQWNFAHFPGSSSLHLAWFSTAALLPSSSPIRVPPWCEIENGECELCSVLAHAGNGGEPEKWGDLSLATFSTTWPRLGFELALAAWNSACPDIEPPNEPT